MIRGKLLTGRDPVFMSAHPVGAESFESEVFDTPPWPADEKVVAEELGPYLAALDAAATSSNAARCSEIPASGGQRATWVPSLLCPWTDADSTSSASACCSKSEPR